MFLFGRNTETYLSIQSNTVNEKKALSRGVVYNAREWVFSSARDYEDEKGLIEISFLL